MKKAIMICLFEVLTTYTIAQSDPCKYVRIYPIIKDSIQQQNKKKLDKKLEITLLFSAFKLDNTISLKSPVYKMNASSISSFRKVKTNAICEKSLDLYDETGFAWIPDSVFTPDKDLSRLKVGIAPSSERLLRWQMNSSIQSQKLRTYSTSQDSSGRMIQIQNAGFFSPGSLLLNGGIEYQPGKLGKIEFGLASGKLIWILNQRLYSMQQSKELAGVPIEKHYKIEGGFNLQSRLEKSIGNHFRWEHSSLWFYPISLNGDIDIQIRNAFFWKPSSSVQACFRTTYSYNETRWPPGTWAGEFSLGYVFSK